MNFKINLEARADKDQKTYYMAKLDAPVFIDASDGLAFLIFLSESGSEELQIAHADNDLHLSKFYLKDNKMKVKLQKRTDSYGAEYYLGKIKFNGLIDCSQNVSSFIVFCSKEGKEELQIVANFVQKPTRQVKKRKIVPLASSLHKEENSLSLEHESF